MYTLMFNNPYGKFEKHVAYTDPDISQYKEVLLLTWEPSLFGIVSIEIHIPNFKGNDEI